jgi:hypothetical protein
MITLETVRAAVLSQEPWARLDELVRTEMAAGQKTKQIFEVLMEMANDIDDTPGLSEDGKDAFGDALDALTGMCHPDCQYKDPPNTTLPAEEEIAKLPRWAQVAFATRCARRVLPLLTGMNPKQLNHFRPRVLMAIDLAERTASGQRFDAQVVVNEVEALNGAVADYEQSSVIAATKAAAYSAMGDLKTVNLAVSYAGSASEEENLVLSIRRDFDHLANLAKWSHWTDDTPVPPEVFGPLWPEGPPNGWPPIADVPQHDKISLTFFAREHAMGQITEDDVVNLFNALNHYHITRGGAPLTYEDLRSLLPALVPAEV